MQRVLGTVGVVEAPLVGDDGILAAMETQFRWELVSGPAAPHVEQVVPEVPLPVPTAAPEITAPETTPARPDYWEVRTKVLRTMGGSALAHGLRSVQPDLPLRSRETPVQTSQSSRMVGLGEGPVVGEIFRSMAQRAAAESPRG
ncbi:MAG TPA: hypothetical protein VLH86_00665 [Patescibacteria group bacterium]|nr:hypothetical protein [Patescibacteria group bacterium]